MSSDDEDKGPTVSASVELFDFRTPTINRFALEDHFDLPAACLQNLKLATTKRDRLALALKEAWDLAVSAPKELIPHVREYLPIISTLVLQTADDMQATRGGLDLRWNSVMNNVVKGKSPVAFEYHSFLEECIHSYFLLAVLHYQLANQVMLGSRSRGSFSKELPTADVVTAPESALLPIAHAIQGHVATAATPSDAKSKSPAITGDRMKDTVTILKVAAGIFAWIETTLVAQLDKKITANKRPFEIAKGTSSALAHLCLANAQELALLAAMQRKASYPVLTKLCIGTASKFQASFKALNNNFKEWLSVLNSDLIDYLTMKEKLYLSLSRMYLSRAAEEELSRPGDAVAYMAQAVNLICEIPNSLSSLPSMVSLSATIHNQQQVTKHAYLRIKNDNDTVYFATVTPDDELPAIPEGTVIVAATQFQPPQPAHGPFLTENPAKPDECIVS